MSVEHVGATDEAVEAAARALYDLDFDDYKSCTGIKWDDLDDKLVYIKAARCILDAAATE